MADLFICPDCEQPRAIRPDSLCPDCAEWRALKAADWDAGYQERLRRVDRLRRLRMSPSARFGEELADLAKAAEKVRNI